MKSFDVYLQFPTGTPEEWGKALDAPIDSLPALTSEDRESAKRWGLRLEDEKRKRFFQSLVDQRLETEGRIIGGAAEAILSVLNHDLLAVLVDGREDHEWRLRAKKSKSSEPAFEVLIPMRLRESVLREGRTDGLRHEIEQAIESVEPRLVR